jgi:hypothetical protein
MLWGLLNNRRIVDAANGIAATAHHHPRRFLDVKKNFRFGPSPAILE